MIFSHAGGKDWACLDGCWGTEENEQEQEAC